MAIGFSMSACNFGDIDKTNGNGSGNSGSGTNPTIHIKNNTGYYLSYGWIKPSTSTNWGSNIYPYLDDGKSTTINLSQPLSVQSVYDIRLGQSSSSGYRFTKYGVKISNNMTVTFTTGDLTTGSELPTITIQNRSGKTFNSVYIKPSSSSAWGESLGSISNNNDKTLTIPIPPSNYTAFDIQMRSSNPTNTYTRNNVTITNGMILTFTSADADNPTIELPVIVIKNNTGYTLNYHWIKPSTSTNWGSYIGTYLQDGESKAITLSQSLSSQSVYDIRLSQSSSSGFKFTKYNLTVTEGMIVTFTTSDLEQ